MNEQPFLTRGSHKKDVIILHETAGSRNPAAKNLASVLLKRRCGTHYYIRETGEVTQFLQDERITRHTVDLNDRAIGIDMAFGSTGPIKTYRGHTWPMAYAQVESLLTLIASLSYKHGITMRTSAIEDSMYLKRRERKGVPSGIYSHFAMADRVGSNSHADGWLHELAVEVALRGYDVAKTVEAVNDIMSVIKPGGRIALPPRLPNSLLIA